MAVKRILIIEDDLELCEELAELLKYEGYYVDYACDPLNGMDLMIKSGYDVILLDNKMPGTSGMEILKKLKSDNIRRHILIVTGKPSAEQLLKNEDLMDMVEAVIKKPIDYEDLLDKIKKTPALDFGVDLKR